jgi:hypothetical protein
MCPQVSRDRLRCAWGSLASLTDVLQGHLTTAQGLSQLALVVCRIPARSFGW